MSHVARAEGRISYASPTDPVWKRSLIRLIEIATGQPKLERMYQTLRQQDSFDAATFWGNSLQKLKVTLDYNTSCLETIPDTGPLVIVANHPFGVLDGLTICHLASRMRANFQILTNSVLCTDPLLDPYLLPVSFDETREATRINIETRHRALHTLKNGGAIVIFPGGGISTAQGWWGEVTDLEWKRFAAKLIQQARATVVPIYFHGQNSRLFQIVSQFSLTLRLSLLLHELNRRSGTSLKISIGSPIAFTDISHIKNRQALLDFLRMHVYSLSKNLTTPVCQPAPVR